jgi:hypothetical protein
VFTFEERRPRAVDELGQLIEFKECLSKFESEISKREVETTIYLLNFMMYLSRR